MNTKEFERRLALLSGWTESEVDQRMRPLRDAGLLERGAGRHAPSFTAMQAVLMLLQLTSRRATEALEVGKRAWKLRAAPPPSAPDWVQLILEGERLLEVLTVAVDSPETVTVHGLRLTADARSAWVTFKRGKSTCEVWFCGSDEDRQWVEDYPDTYANQGAAFVGHSLLIGHGIFAEIALSLQNTKQSGWVSQDSAVEAID